MPHLIIEYAADHNETPMQLVQAAHNAAINSGLFGIGDIKTRAYPAQHYVVGGGGGNMGFVHVRVYLLEGRTVEQKRLLHEKVWNALAPLVAGPQHLTVDIRDMVKDTYRKGIVQ